MKIQLLVVTTLPLLAQSLLATQVLRITPSPGAVHQLPSANIVVTFDSAIDPTTVSASSFRVDGELSARHPGNFSFTSGDTEITYTPISPFNKGETMHIVVSSQIKDALGLAIASWGSQFTVMTDPSAGEFAQGQVYGAGENPFSVLAHDLNGDGNLDMVLANTSWGGSGTSKTISVLIGRGDGTFAPKIDYPTETADSPLPLGVSAGDLDGDGFSEIVVANLGSATVAVLRNDGAGGFSAPQLFPVASNPLRLRIADLDGDGMLDIAVTHTVEGVSLLFGNGDGTFAAPVHLTTGKSHWGLALCDLNRDGRLDIAISDTFNNGSFYVILGLGNRTFAPPVGYSVGVWPRDVAVTDFNGDGWPDIVTAGFLSGNITLYTNNGDGTFAGRADYLVNGSPVGVTACDVNGDGWPDIASANYSGGSIYNGRSVSVWMNNGGGAFAVRKDLNAGGSLPVDLVAADFDHDGDLDLATANWSGNSASFLKNAPATITGSVFLDQDRNCTRNVPNEVGVGGRLVLLTDNSGVAHYEITGLDGTFASVVPAGSYRVNLVHTATTAETCDNGRGVIYDVTVAEGRPVGGLNFAAAPCCQASVSCVSQISWPCPLNPPVPCTHNQDQHYRYVCPCEPFQYAVTVCNSCTSTLLPGTIIQLQLDPNVMFCSFPPILSTANNVSGSLAGQGSANPNPSCDPDCNPNTGQLVQWKLGSALPAGNCATFFVTVQAANVALGTVLNAIPSLTAKCNPGNVPISVTGLPCQDNVLCSYDPNDKTVSPAGCGPFGNVAPGTPLTYRVRFQNLGNAPARRVRIVDFLDRNLDANTLEIVSTSHPVSEFKILPSQEMIWTFNGINLPDATSDEAASHGEVVYRVRPKPSAGEGTTILNTAAIFFDLNAPVITATTTNTLRSVSMPNTGFSSALVSAGGPWVLNFTYTGGTADAASFAWDFGTEATPLDSTAQNPAGVSYPTAGPKLVTLTVTRYGCVETNQRVVWVGPCDGTPTLSLQRLNHQWIISWTECGILQVAENIAGPWRDIVARSPYTAENSGRQRFYRTRK